MEDVKIKTSVNSVRVEDKAVSILNLVLLKSPYLQPVINSNDRTPSWDGDIYIYSSDNRNKANLRFPLPVQVKGTCSTKKSRKKITYPCEVRDLNNYYRGGGCILFLISVDSQDERSKIYYASLTPFELCKILKKIPDKTKQKRCSIELKEFPKDNPNEIFNICVAIAEDCEKQRSFIKPDSNSTISLADILKMPDVFKVDEFSFGGTTLGVDPLNIDKYITTHRHFLYAKLKDWNYLVPVEPITISGISVITDGQVMVGGEVYYDSFVRNTVQGQRFISIGKAMTMSVPDNDKTPAKLNFTPKGTLGDLIKDTAFFIDLLETKSFNIGDLEIPIPVRKKSDISKLKADLAYYKKTDLMLQRLGVIKPLNLEPVTQTDWRNIHVFMDEVLYSKGISFSNTRKDVLITYGAFKICNLNIMLWIEKKEDGCYTVRNFFDREFYPKIECIASEKERSSISRYVLLTKQNFLDVANLDVQAISDEVYSYPSTPLFVYRVQRLLLEVLKAYDEMIVKDEALMELAENICKYVDSANMLAYKESQVLNRCQIKKRKARLDINDKRELVALTEASYPLDIRCGACLLLDEEEKAQEYFDQMDAEKQKEFLKYPICIFGKLTQKSGASDTACVD